MTTWSLQPSSSSGSRRGGRGQTLVGGDRGGVRLGRAQLGRRSRKKGRFDRGSTARWALCRLRPGSWRPLTARGRYDFLPASWLESNGEDSAAASLREGLDETLTGMRLNLPATLRRTFATTNAIENMNGSLRRIARNVKRWKDEKMTRRWVALGIGEAQKGFRRVKGYVNMPSLVAAIRPTAAPVAPEKKVA